MAAPDAVRSGTTGCNRQNPANPIGFEPVSRRTAAPRAWRFGLGGDIRFGEKQGERPMKILSAAAVAMLLTAPAYAQMQTPNINLMPEFQSKTPGRKGAGCNQGKGLQGIAEEDSRRQDLVRSVGHGAQQRCAEDRRPGQAEDQDRQQRPAQPVTPVAIVGRDSESISAIAILGRSSRGLELRHGLASARSCQPDGCPAEAGRRLSARELYAAPGSGPDEGARLPQALSRRPPI